LLLGWIRRWKRSVRTTTHLRRRFAGNETWSRGPSIRL
jgi:hypothetical protein